MSDHATLWEYWKHREPPRGMHTSASEALIGEQIRARKGSIVRRALSLVKILLVLAVPALLVVWLFNLASNAVASIETSHVVGFFVLVVVLKISAFKLGMRRQAYKNVRASMRGQRSIMRN